MLNINPFKNTIGLDISDFKIRFVQLAFKRNSKIKIFSFGEIPVPNGLINAGKIANENQVVSLIRDLVSKPQFGKITTKFVNASLPDKRTFIKSFEIPNVPDNEIKGAVAWGIEQNIPITIDQVYFDWQIISPWPAKNEKKIKVLSLVAPKEIANQYTRIIKKSGLIPIGFENESIPIARCLISQDKPIKTSLVIVDIGRSRTNLIIYTDNIVKFTSTIEVSGFEMTSVIAKTMKLSFEDAEKAKIIYGLDKKKARGAIRKMLEPILTRLSIKISENIEYFNNYLSKNKKINTILLTGSVSNMLGLTEFLNSKLNLTVLLGDSWTNLKTLERKDEIKKKNKFFSYATAIGLALKKFN